ncbi:zinc-dependent alcohol dehydrogenase family protein [Anaeromyxobacter dehalogenans]|uniref:Zinc-binding alcohol dehydrogenase n=1 Tax=Anaeromyxobacter dehalogenans (strain 2CP-C) TaxID=290397 RepID=Q2IFD2_ANADE|nr:NAD(P)-dependent alcohol dehydrogenase [Anaeromyxobacter dehalogenans]ABC83293.1 zinc-binding alcohol dehydrogenase [Anaeromyxobacter dehalogenans 2CP-C]
MRSWHLDMGAGLSGLRLEEHAEPRPGPGEVVVRVRAASINARELSILFQGRYPLPVKPGVVAASDGAGEVVEIGPGVTGAAVGERVIASIFPRWRDGPFRRETAAQLGGSLDGMLTEYAVLPAEALVRIPPHLSFEEAAALPCAGATAWNALTGGRPLSAGETVLTLGSGGVSLLALQLARSAGARTLVTTSGAARAARLSALGADEVIDREATPDWAAEVRRRTGDAGADHIVEVGGPGTLERSARAVALGGEIAWVGALARAASPPDLTPLWMAAATLRCIAAGSTAQLAAMTRAVAAHRIRPVIAQVFPFAEALAAFACYAAGAALGKILVRV